MSTFSDSPTRPKAIMCWSGGKDSAYCLDKVRREGIADVRYLLTTLSGVHKRVSMHGVREELLDRQVEAVGLPCLKVWVSEASNNHYEEQMAKILLQAKAEGVTAVIFGDIHLEDLRRYREKQLEQVGLKAIFPLWKTDTTALINSFIHLGFRTVVVCVNEGYFPEKESKSWLGSEIDSTFLRNAAAAGIDVCGENGEFHTFCYDGPVFTNRDKCPIRFTRGEAVFKPLEFNIVPTDNKDGSDGVEDNNEKKEAAHCDSGLPVLKVTRGFWFLDLLPSLDNHRNE